MSEMIEKNAQLPAFMQDETNETGLDKDQQQFIRPPFLKVVKGNSSDLLSAGFSPDDIIVHPQNVLICPKGESFLVTPVSSFTQYGILNPFQMRDKLPFWREVTNDAKSEIAEIALAFDERKKFACPENEQHMCEHVVVHRFICLVHGNDEIGHTPVAMSFLKSSTGQGQNFINLINMRGKPMYCDQFECYVDEWKSGDYTVRGLAVRNPSVASPWVEDEQTFTLAKGLFDRFQREKSNVDFQDNHDEQQTVPASETGAFE